MEHHTLLLKELSEDFNKEGLYTQMLSNQGLSILKVQLQPDAKERLLHAELLFIPKLQNLDVLQFFILLPFSINDATAIPLTRFLSVVNEQLPLGSFNLNEDSGMIYYKHLQPCQKGQIPFQLVWEIMGMLNLMVDLLASGLEEVASGVKEFQKAKSEFLEKMNKLSRISDSAQS